MKYLGSYEKFGPLNIKIPRLFRSNNVKECLVCGVKITVSNDSGWELFKEGSLTTQPVCCDCDEVLMGQGVVNILESPQNSNIRNDEMLL